MPNRLVALSSNQRSLLLAATMIALLAASLGAGYIVSRARSGAWTDEALDATRVHIGDLRVAVPRGWQPVQKATATAALGDARTFEDPRQPGQQLTIALLNTANPEPPAAILNAAIHIFVTIEPGEELRTSDPTTVVSPPMVGLRRAAFAEGPAATQQHFIGVMTEDGRRYWLFHLTDELATSDLRPEQYARELRLLDAICHSAVDGAYRDATGADLIAAGLGAVELPKGLQLRVDTHQAPIGALNLLPGDAVDRLRFLRIRGVPDSGATQPGDPLSPEELLTAEIRLAGGAPAADAAAATSPSASAPPIQPGTAQLWHADLPRTGTAPDGGLTRQLWFARLAPGRAAVIEAVSEPGAEKRLTAMVPTVVEALATAAKTLPDLRPEVQAALGRGAALARLTRRGLGERLGAGRRFDVISVNHQVVGCAIYRNIQPPAGTEWEFQGTMEFALAEARGSMIRSWGCSSDAQHFALLTQEAWAGIETTPVSDRWARTELEVNKGRLLYVRAANAHAKPQTWSAAAPPGLLLPVDPNAWPTELIQDPTTTPAIVWVCWGSGPPIAYWLDRAHDALPQSPDAPSGPTTRPEPAAQLLLWPMMGMDPTRVTLDAQGRAIRVDRCHQGRTPADPDGATYVAVDEAALQRQFPKLQGHLDDSAPQEKTP